MEEFYELIDLVVTNEVLMGGDFNGDVGSDMDRVFQVVVRGGDWEIVSQHFLLLMDMVFKKKARRKVKFGKK